jgi:NADPH:quinone reductase-like Zn-dependent oxidoreductase
MRAIVLEKFGGLDSLVYKDIPDPEPQAGHVVIEIKAFGLNHAELHMRRGEWAEAAPVSGIECVGLVKSCPGGEFPVGAKVASLMGGLGRTINGSYAEYTRARASSLALIESNLPWAELAAIPETYATAWTCLFRNLEVKKGRVASYSGCDLLVRSGRAEDGGKCGGSRDWDDPQSRALLRAGEVGSRAMRDRTPRSFETSLGGKDDRCDTRPSR